MNTMGEKTRRTILRSGFGLIAGSAFAGVASGQENEPSVKFETQATKGDEITVAQVVTESAVSYSLENQSGKRYVWGEFEGGQHLENITIKLDDPIMESGQYRFSIYPKDGGYAIDSEVAQIFVTENGEFYEGMPVTEIESDPEAGFNYPYYLYVPPSIDKPEEAVPIFVQTSNSPSSSDDFSYHKQKAREQIGWFPKTIANELKIPALVPVIPRPRDKTEFEGRPWFQGLDIHSLQVSDHPAARIDLQVLNMVDDARERLQEESYQTSESIMMNGFSSSAEFVNRFSIIHPERVLSVSAGGLTGMVVLPRKEAKGHTLNYHIGIANIEELIGKPFNKDAFAGVNHYYYMGSEDTEDNFPYETLWPDDLETIAREVYGENIIEERFPYCENIYDEEGIDAKFEIHEGVGHRMGPARDDLIAFHRDAHATRDSKDSTATENETAEETMTTTTTIDSATTTTEQMTSVTERDSATSSIESPTTTSEAPGLSLFSGLTGVIGATYIGSRLLNSSEE